MKFEKVEKDFTLSDMMEWSHELEKMRENVDMMKALLEIDEFQTIKKKDCTE